MSTRIQRLFHQALNHAGPDTHTTFTFGEVAKINERFAELIVAECVSIGDNYQDILGNEPECFNCRKVAYGIVDKIREHFGVEE